MTKLNAKNERMKRQFYLYRKQVDGKDDKTIAALCIAIERFEAYTGFRDFTTFNSRQAVSFKDHLSLQRNAKTGKPLALHTRLTSLKTLQSFFGWLALQPGYKSKIRISDIDYFNMTDKDERAARASSPVDFPSLQQVREVLATMPVTTDTERRDRAIIAFTMLTGVRDSALVTLKLKHVNLALARVNQDPKEVDTKASKHIVTYFFPVGDDIQQIVADWIGYLENEKLFSPTDPLFPKTERSLDDNQCFVTTGLSRDHWQGTQAVRNIFRQAFTRAGQPYYKPHSLRHTLGHLMQDSCRTLKEIKAWSQNLGHTNVNTSITSYGHMSHSDQGAVVKGMSRPDNDEDLRAKIRELLG
jgi:integrase/recombinase XerD